MPKWTTSQESAINIRNSNVLVSAAAGSGKTAVLVERVIKKITDETNPVNIDELLIVTFTNAAAAEMKSRIAEALNKIISVEPNNSNAIKQLSLLPNAKISTIDSFCINLVRENFFKLDIEQDFSILDDSQEKIIQDNAIETILEEYYSRNDSDFEALVEMFSASKNDNEIVSTIKAVNNFIMVQAFPFEWLDNLAQAYNPEISIEDSFFGKYIRNQINSYLDVAFDVLENSENALMPEDRLYDKLRELVYSDKAIFEGIKNAKTWDEMVDIATNSKFMKLTNANSEFSSKEDIKLYRTIYKDIFDNNIQPLLTTKEEQFLFDNEYLYSKVEMFCNIVKQFNTEILNQKKEVNSYSFADIEQFAIKLLFSKDGNGNIIRSDISKEYEVIFDEILIDEYQDTNKAQDALFEAISNGKNRFMVGDVKQSIYKFRLAMPQIFTNKKNTYDAFPTEGSQNQTIVLDKNFRSRKCICNFTNFIFKNLMTTEVGELDYNESEYLYANDDYLPTDVPSAQLKISAVPDDENIDEYEAKQVANYIINKVASKEQIKDGDTYRNVKYSDFAVLFRAASKRMPIFYRVLTEYGVPVVANNKLNLFETNEITILISLLKVIDNPIQDIPVLSTLMSAFYGYSADDIASAKIKKKSKNLYGSIVGNDDFKNFVDDINKYRKYASSMSIEAFLRQLIADTSYLSLVSAMGNAEQRRLNVMKLVDLAKIFDGGKNVGLTSFMRYIDSIISNDVNVESASVITSEGNAVNLMTIHKSKGLEFPICIFVGNNHIYNYDELKENALLNSNYGIGLKIYDDNNIYRYNSVQYNCIKNINLTSSMSENLRVLYVALTRAKEQFVMFYTDKDPARHISSLRSKIINSSINPITVKGISKDCDLILLCALLHKDGKELRNIADLSVIPNDEFDFDWNIEFLDELIEDEPKETQKISPNDTIVKTIEDRLSFAYERNSLSNYSAKRTASSLDKKDHGYKFFASSKPAFLNKSGMTASEKGTAMHAFMQFCDYENAKSNLELEIERLASNSYITKEQADSLDRKRLNNLFESDFASRMFNAVKIYREIKVSTFVPVCELEDTDYDDKVLIQGIADCVFEENGELVLVDYKTDKVENENELLDLYKKQVEFYKNAISKVLEKPVKQAVLYSFYLNKVCIYK